MRKLWSLLLTIAMISGCLAGGAAAEGDGVLMAAPIFDTVRLEKYAAFQLDDATGEWSVHASEVETAFRLIDDQASRYTAGLLYFCLELNGNKNTNLLMPSLDVYYLGGEALNSTALSIRVGDVRYDFPVAAQPAQILSRSAELMRIPLDAEGLQLVRDMLAADEVLIRLHGDDQYTATAQLAQTYRNTRAQIEAISLLGLQPMLDELDALGFGGYALWDLNRAKWEQALGYEPRMEQATLKGDVALSDVELDEDFDLLAVGDKGRSVTALEKQLIALNLLSGTADTTYGVATSRAVRAAQRYQGDIETGSVDAALLERLFSGTLQPVEPKAEAAVELPLKLGDVADLGIDRYWYASAVSASRASGALAERSVANRDNALIAFDGHILNTSLQSLDLTWQLNATVTSASGYAYPCTILCERDEGMSFDGALIPMGQSRLVIYAEIPASAASGDWTLSIQSGDAALSINALAADQ